MNQLVEITAGPFAGFKGVINLIDFKNKRLTVKINFWGREVPVELKFTEIRPLADE